MMTVRAVLVIITAALLAACASRNDAPAPIPRPTAYPRVADPGTVYTSVDSLPVTLEVSEAAVVERPRADWLNIIYPDWSVTVHVSVTAVDPAEFERALDNRMQRLHLNVASLAVTDEIELDSPDFSSVIISSPDSRSTPLQFIAAAEDSAVIVSGVAFFSNVAPDAPVDSLAPVVRYLRRDLTHALENLTYR